MDPEMLEFKRRWALVNAAEIEELRSTPLGEKARQTAALMESARGLGGMDLNDPQEEEVRDRWDALRRRRPTHDV
jgi:hypothetical protein